MSTPFIPIPRPPNTQNCEDGIYAGTLPSQICNPDVICNLRCIDVVIDDRQEFDTPLNGGVYSYTIQKTRGSSPIVWTITTGALPAGLALNASTGAITGTVTETEDNTGSVEFTATNCDTGTSTITWEWTVGGCTAPSDLLPASGDIAQPVVGVDYTVAFTASGSGPLVFTVTSGAAGLTAAGITLAPDGTLTWAGADVDTAEHVFEVTATGPCGSVAETYTIQGTEPVTPKTLRWGNLAYPGAPAAAPTFVEGDFISGGPLFSDYTEAGATAAVTRVGSYIFPSIAGTRQVMWIADSLLVGTETFMVSGLPWGLDPGDNTYLQSLTIAGVAGKVFFTSDRNGGSYTVDVT